MAGTEFIRRRRPDGGRRSGGDGVRVGFRHGSEALLGGAAALWLVGFFLPATASGSGSTISGRAFADLIGSGTLTVSAPRWFGAVLYLVPLAAAVLLVTLVSDHPSVVGLRLVAAAVATLAALAFAAVVADWRPARVGTGSWVAIAGSCLAVAGATSTLRRRGGHHGDR
ncbi:hypothetical protein AB0L40_23435 [Patulibacter sp. NPDC049589]|uniref:hypothetical protein n=1 Tax=Patulibacter sp. NPDC049589 TaxID=3154731 RepID=UPI00341C3E79